MVGIPLTVIWAIVNGITAFVLVWLWGPALRYAIVWIYAFAPAVTTPMRALISPIVDVLARIFRQCRIQANVSGSLERKLTGQ